MPERRDRLKLRSALMVARVALVDVFRTGLVSGLYLCMRSNNTSERIYRLVVH